jgi:hypothetical protein
MTMAKKDKKEPRKPEPVSFTPTKKSEPKPYVDKNVIVKSDDDDDVTPAEKK